MLQNESYCLREKLSMCSVEFIFINLFIFFSLKNGKNSIVMKLINYLYSALAVLILFYKKNECVTIKHISISSIIF